MKYRAAFEQWRRAYLEEHLEKAANSVTRMAAETGLNRAHIYKLCEKAGVKVSGRPGRGPQKPEGGNAEWHALSDKASA